MSRIGKQPVVVPPKVKVEVKGQKVFVEGPKGKLDFELPSRTRAALDKGQLLVTRDGEDAQARALHGLSRSILNNMVLGVSEGFVKKLEIQGVGFKAAVQGPGLRVIAIAADNNVAVRHLEGGAARQFPVELALRAFDKNFLSLHLHLHLGRDGYRLFSNSRHNLQFYQT